MWVLFLNYMNFVFEIFNVSLFALNQSANFASSKLSVLKSLTRSASDIRKVVSSAYNYKKKSDAFGRSLIKNMNKIGPSMDP